MSDRQAPRPDEAVSGPPLPEPERTLGALLRDRAARWAEREVVRYRGRSGGWESLTWTVLDQRRRALAAGLLKSGVEPGEAVAIVSPNRVEMLVAEAAILSIGAACAPIFPEYNEETLGHCLRDSGASLILCGSAQEQDALPAVRLLPRVRQIAVLDDFPHPGAVPLSQIEWAGAEDHEALAAADAALEAVQPEAVAYLLYTSGTTGRPKGVELTHRNVLSQQAALKIAWDVSERDTFLAYLPWHHCFGALFERFTALSTGARLVLDDSRGRNIDRLLANVREIRPTVYFSVPRVYQALMVRAQREPAALEAFFHPGLRACFTAAAPPPLATYRFFEERGLPIIEGWGLTETSPCVTITPQRGPRAAGVVGWPLAGTTVRLAPTPAADEPGVGEVLVRGPQVMRGYHRDPEATARVLDHGWLRTGDLGEWTPMGLRIRGRVDGVFKLENGEKVASYDVEARLMAATPLIEQALVIGSGQPFASALVWLSAAAVRAWCEGHGVPAAPMAELAAMPELRLTLAEALRAGNLLAPVRHERVRRVAVLHDPPSLERGELTPTLKLVRTALLERHADLVAALQGRALDPRVLELGRRDE